LAAGLLSQSVQASTSLITRPCTNVSRCSVPL
jgi:hypothetical protein